MTEFEEKLLKKLSDINETLSEVVDMLDILGVDFQGVLGEQKSGLEVLTEISNTLRSVE